MSCELLHVQLFPSDLFFPLPLLSHRLVPTFPLPLLPPPLSPSCTSFASVLLYHNRFWRVALAAAELEATRGGEAGEPELRLEALRVSLRALPLANKLTSTGGEAGS